MSSKTDEGLLRDALRNRQSISAPDFHATWERATARHRNAKRRYVAAGGMAAAAAAIALVSMLRPDPVADNETAQALFASTYWQAPSDALMPRPQIDVYNDLPELMQPAAVDEGDL